jgi:hypothetical protein
MQETEGSFKIPIINMLKEMRYSWNQNRKLLKEGFRKEKALKHLTILDISGVSCSTSRENPIIRET